MLQVILPHALVLGSVDVLVDAWAICFVVCPESVIDVTVHVDETALSVSSVLAPLTRIFGTVWPLLLTEAVSEASLPFSCVHSSSLELVRLSLLSWLVRIV